MMRAILLSFIISVTLSACLNEPQLPPLTNDYSLNDRIPLSLLEEASISQENIHIAFAEVKEESRCPIAWQCLWEGEAEVELTVKKGDFIEKIRLKYDGGNCTECGNTATAFGYKIKLEQLSPFPDETFYAQKPLDFNTYKIVITVINDNDKIYL